MLSQFFAHPLMLAGIAAIAAPIALFLLNRFRFQTIDWAAQLFLQRAFQRQKRRLQIENLLLLLVRCLILIMIATAMAQPRLESGVVKNEGEATRNVLIAIDTSYSMGYQVGTNESETSLAQARRTAIDLISSLKDGDRVNVIAFDTKARPLYRTGPIVLSEVARAKLLGDLTDAPDMQATERGTDFNELLRALPDALRPYDFSADGKPPSEGAQPSPKAVFILTDSQRRNFLDGKGRPLDRGIGRVGGDIKKLGAQLLLVECGAAEPRNVTVTRIATRDPVAGRGLPCDVEVTVRNSGSAASGELSLEYWVDGERDQSVTLSLQADEEQTLEARRLVFKDSGLHRVEVRIKSDPLKIDSRRHLVIDVRDEVRVLLVDGERKREALLSETDWLKEALEVNAYGDADGPGLIRTEVIRESELESQDLRNYDVVFLANVVSFDEKSVTALEEYAHRGGVVVFGVGGLVNRDAYNQFLWREGAGIFPAKLLEPQGGTYDAAKLDQNAPEWVLEMSDVEDHALEIFATDEYRDWLRGGSVFGYYQVEVAEKSDSPAWVPLRLVPRNASGSRSDLGATGDPFLVERKFGRGRTVAWLTSLDSDWTNLPVYDVFYVVFWQAMVLDLSQRTRPPIYLKIGGRYDRVLEAAEYASRVKVVSPDDRHEGVPLEKLAGEEGYRLTFPLSSERAGLQVSGLYTLTRKGVAQGEDPPPDYFAVAVDPDEGDLAKFTALELSGALGLEVRPLRSELAREALQSDLVTSGSRDYWHWFMAAALVLLVVESVLAAFFGRRRR
ncbi:MAG: BatA domain-containing protein [Planctomycetes bacterium]|nr:BatA domain-containing protein [Planctomycetota bacterium]